MKETELERLVVRLTGDAAQYTKMLTEAQKKTQEVAHAVEKQASRIEKFQHGLEKFGATAGGVFSSIGIVASLKKAYEKFDEASDTIEELSAVITANGNIVSDVLPKYEKFGKEMAKVTTTSKGATLSLLKQAEALGLSGDKAEKAIKNAITLGAIKDTDAGSFIRQTVNFEKTGNASGIARVLGLIGEMEEGTDKAAQVTELLAKNWALVEVKGADGSAKIARAQAAMGGIVKDVGAIVASVVEPLIDKVGKLADWFTSLNSTVRNVIVGAVLLVAAVEPLIIAYGFLTARVIALNSVLVASRAIYWMTAERVMLLTDAYLAMSAKARIAMISVGALTIVVAAAAIATYIAWSRAIAKVNEEIERGTKLDEKRAALVVARRKPLLDQLDKTKNPSERATLVKDELKTAQDRLGILEKQLETGKGIVKKMDEGLSINLKEAQIYKETAAKVESIQKETDAQRDYVKALQEAAKISPKAITDAEDLIEKYHQQAITAGMTAEQIELLNTTKALGSEHYLSIALRENQELAESAKKHADATKEITDFNTAMQLQIATFGMSAEQAKLYKAQLAGVDEGLLRQSKQLIDAVDAQDRLNQMYEEGAALMRKHLTPLEQYDQQVQHLMDLWGSMAIDDTTFFQEMEEAAAKFDELTMAAQEATAAIGENNAIKAGGAATKGAIFSYTQSLNAQQNSQTKPITDRLDRGNVLLGKIAEGVDFEGADL